MVETTAWEGKDYSPAEREKTGDKTEKPSQHYHWSSNWHNADSAR